MHFAAYAYVGESNFDPLKYYDNNVGGTVNLLRSCAAYDCKNFVFSSSCATYGIPTQLPLTEDHEQVPVNPYGYTKLEHVPSQLNQGDSLRAKDERVYRH